jgi:hypothetical protein
MPEDPPVIRARAEGRNVADIVRTEERVGIVFGEGGKVDRRLGVWGRKGLIYWYLH